MGFLGSHVVRELHINGISSQNIIVPKHKEYDLVKLPSCKKVASMGDIIIHLAAMVGGIGLNKEKPGTMFYKNTIAGIQLMEEARIRGVEKFVAIGTVCAYPKYTKVPFKEEDLWSGYPEETNAPYGLAKKMLLVQSQAYRQEFNFNSIFLLPVNLYGPGDNFNPKSSHVIPALIKKNHEAILNNEKQVVVRGDGSPTREFLYVKDAARAIILATKKLVNLISKTMGYKGKIVFDPAKPNGQPKRKLDVSKAQIEFGFKARVSLKEGLEKTISWYLKKLNLNVSCKD